MTSAPPVTAPVAALPRASRGPLFLTTIPKSGTHLVIEFLKRCGFLRQPIGEIPLVGDIERRFFHDHHRKDYESALGIALSDVTRAEVDASHADHLAISRRLIGALGPGHYGFYHVPHDPGLIDCLRAASVPMILLVRDPRDVAVSLANHIMRHPEGKKYRTLANLATDEERYLAVVAGRLAHSEGEFPLLPLAFLFERYEGWLTEPGVLVMRYEDVIGIHGGGDAIAQIASYARLADHVGIDIDPASLQAIVEGIYSENAPFFVNGRLGQWRRCLTPTLEGAFAQHLGQTIDVWGYR